jgi:uncharacterized integral membrane protein
MRLFILIGSIVIIIAIFSTQNSQPVAVSVIAWQFHVSVAIIVFLSLVCGIIIGFTASFLIKLSKKRRERGREHLEIEIKNGKAS